MDDEPRDDQPCLFAPERDGAGYRLTRRSFLAAAAAGAAQSLVGCGVANHATGVDLMRLKGGRVMLADNAPGTEFRAHAAAVAEVAVSADGQTLTTSSCDGSIRTWSWPEGDLVQRAPAAGAVRAVAAELGSQRLASVAVKPAGLTLRGLPDGRAQGDAWAIGAPWGPVAWSPDGTLLVIGAGPVAEVWSVLERKRLGELAHRAASISALRFSPSGRSVACGGRDGTVSFWSVPGWQPLGVGSGHRGAVNAVCFVSRRRVATAGEDGSVRLWSPSGEALSTLTSGTTAVTAVAASRSGKRIAYAAGGTITVSGLADNGQPVALPKHTGPVTVLAFAPDARYLMAGDAKGVVTVYDLSTVGRMRFARCWALWDVTIDREIEVDLVRCELPNWNQPDCVCNVVWAAPDTTNKSSGPKGCICNSVILNGVRPTAGTPQMESAAGPSGCACNLICVCDRICTCNTVSRGRDCQGHCTCNRVCTCDSVSRRR